MITLDEVIRANECCDHGEPDSRCEDCPYSGIGACCLERENDALRYLKQYKERKETLRYWSEKAISELQNFADAYMFYKSENEKDNNPLTWEELESMEGKPVWYEHEFWKGWIILGKVEQGVNCEMIPDREERWYIVKDGSAKAYRKERE